MDAKLLVIATIAFGLVSADLLYLNMPSNQSSRIINGQQATQGEFPHQIALLNNNYHSCGGSIIANGWALTAAHCVEGQSTVNLAVIVDLHDYSNPGNYIWFYIQQIIMHPSYNQGPGGFPNDVALLKLDNVRTPVNISKNIIELATSNQNFQNQICVISGWGTTETGSGATLLMKTNVRVLSSTECRSAWGASNILSQHVCVKGEDTANGSGSCNGDSGSPLVCGGRLAGVTSWGRSGCHLNGVVTHPSVYAGVAYFRSWISSACGNCV